LIKWGHMNYNFTDKVVVVTGASKGIGRRIAEEFSRLGATTVLLSRTESALIEVKDGILRNNGKAVSYACDVSSFEQFSSVIAEVLKELGTIDILVNNAGITRDNLIMRLKNQDWDQVVDINLKGVFNGIKAVTRPMMKSRSGSIINITSVVGQIGNAGQSNYAAAKAGVIGLTKSAAKELSSRNITVNAVAPGYIQTEMTENLGDSIKENLLNSIPLSRLGSTQDVADLVLFLASDHARYITGQTLNVDGGMVMV